MHCTKNHIITTKSTTITLSTNNTAAATSTSRATKRCCMIRQRPMMIPTIPCAQTIPNNTSMRISTPSQQQQQFQNRSDYYYCYGTSYYNHYYYYNIHQQQRDNNPIIFNNNYYNSNNPKQQRLLSSSSSSSNTSLSFSTESNNNNNNTRNNNTRNTKSTVSDTLNFLVDPIFDKLYPSTRQLLASLVQQQPSVLLSNKNNINTRIDVGTQIIQNPQLLSNLENYIEQWFHYITKDIYTNNNNNINYSNTIPSELVVEWIEQHQRDGIDIMNELYTVWFRTVQYVRNRKLQDEQGTVVPSSILTTSTTTYPFQIMMQLYTTSMVPNNNGTKALQILNDWNDLYQGDLELRPSREDYNFVLQAYATISYPQGTTGSNTTIQDTNVYYQPNIVEGAIVAMEIREQLELWGYTMHPNLRTYQLIIKCLSNAIIFERCNTNNNDNSISIETLTNDLQSTMEQLLQQFTTNNSTKRQTDYRYPDISSLHGCTVEEYVTLVTAMSDYIRSIDAIIQQSQNDTDGRTILSDPLVEQILQYWSQLFSLDPSNRQRTKLNVLKGSLSGVPKHSLLLLQDSSNELYNLLDTTTVGYLELYRQKSLLTSQSNDNTDDIVNNVTHYMNSLKQQAIDNTMIIPTLSHYHKAILIIKNCRKNRVYDEHKQQQYQPVSQYLLEQMKDLYETHIPTRMDGTERTSWSSVYMMGCLDAEQYGQVCKIWDDMKRKYRIRPDALSYNLILHALANGPKDGAMQRAQQAHSIWKKLLTISFSTTNTTTTSDDLESASIHDDDDDNDNDRDRRPRQTQRTYGIHPNARHYASVMVAWSRSYHPNAATYCQEVFHRLVQDSIEHPVIQLGMPSLIHYTALITTLGWSKQPGTNRRVIQLFHDYQKHATGTTHSPSEHYDTDDSDEVDTKFKMYSSVLYALSRLTKTTEDAIQAEEILNDMMNELVISHNGATSSFPNVECYNSVLKAWGRSGSLNSYDHCDKIFQKLQIAYQKSNCNPVLMPNSTTYVAIIEALSSHHTKTIPNSGMRAMELLDRMERSAQRNESTEPDAKVYTAVMTTIWKENQNDALGNVDRILARMIESYENGNLAAKPDAHTMTVVLQTWARSNRPDKASRAWKILEEQMLEPYQHGDISMKPSVYSFAAVLSACAHSEPSSSSSDDVIRIALTVMNHLDSGIYGTPNEYTYKNLLQAICYHTDDSKERGRLVGVIFQRCCQDGYVSADTLRILQKYAPNLYKKLPMDTKTSKLKIPFEWNRSIFKKNI